MGIFDFVKDAGKSLFDSDEAKVEDITKHLNETFPGQIFGLQVSINEDVVKLAGTVVSQEVKKKSLLSLGNIKGIGRVDSREYFVADAGQPETPAPSTEELEAEAEEIKAEFYTIKKGDSLSLIAKEFYGNPMKYKELFEANKEVIKNPDLIYPGQVIRIPKL